MTPTIRFPRTSGSRRCPNWLSWRFVILNAKWNTSRPTCLLSPVVLQAEHMQRLKKKQVYGPDVWIREDGLVEKSYRSCNLPVRLIGRALVAREAYIYDKLKGLTGIPECHGRPDPYTLLTVYMGGADLRGSTRKPGSDFFVLTRQIIESMHTRGVIHLDLRNRRNYGMDDAGAPYLLDFASALYVPDWHWLRRILAVVDWLGYIKVKAKLAPELMNDEDQRFYRLSRTLSQLWLPTKAFNAVKDLIKYLKSLVSGVR